MHGEIWDRIDRREREGLVVASIDNLLNEHTGDRYAWIRDEYPNYFWMCCLSADMSMARSYELIGKLNTRS